MLKEHYIKTVVPKLKERLGRTNLLALPKLQKVVINVGVGKHLKDEGYVDFVEKTIVKITGQKPIRTTARISISNFKVREGQVVGLKVTLRGARMYDFTEKLLRITFPRVRDFHGISTKGFDKNGNYTIGFKEQLAFPEVTAEDASRIHGLEITFVTSAADAKESRVLLEELGFPFKK